MLNIIIGKRSNLSTSLQDALDNTILVSSQNIIDELNLVDFGIFNTVNIIFNQFQTASKLYNLSSPPDYINKSIVTTSKALDFIEKNKIAVNKIIYTSSSSVYGNNASCLETDNVQPMSLHASLKVANEHLVSLFAKKLDIDYTITRIFNMYGGRDQFSIVSKMISSYKKNSTLTLVNEGGAIRDFIHIDDVVEAYKKILLSSDIPIVNIGSSEGKSLLYIINYLRERGIALQSTNIAKDELKVSICQNQILMSLLKNHTFTKVEEYIYKELKNEHG